jgi:hypothetical protein
MYKRAICEAKQKADRQKKQKLAYKFANGDNKGFWKGWKTLKGHSRNDFKYSVSGCQSKIDICKGFKEFFESNFVNSWDNNEFYERFRDVESSVYNEFITGECSSFTLSDVLCAINKLGIGKACGIDGLPAEAVKYCHPCIVPILQNVFNACCMHGFVPSNFCSGRLVPVPKKRGVCGNFQDFRPVTTANTLGKIFEYCILSRLEQCYVFNDLQFGFTSGGGCEKAVHVVRSVIEYFNEYGSTVYLAALDISKAYDRLNHCAILLKMRKVNVPVDLIMVFWYWFQHLYAVVVWYDIISEQFDVKSGVRQGGVASCWIFNLVIDGLIDKLECSGFGCYFQSVFAGCVLYADDVLLMSASLTKLQSMLDLCEEFVKECGLLFNVSKSVCFVVGKDCELMNKPPMLMYNECIMWGKECCYLGVTIVSGKEFVTNVETRRRKFCSAANDILSLRSVLSEECIMHIINVQALPILAYGAAVWKIGFEMKRRIGVCLNDCVRKVFNYKRYESVRQVLHGFGMLSMEDFMIRSRLLFISNVLRSDRQVVRKCGQYVRDKYEFLQLLMKYDIGYDMAKYDIKLAFTSLLL